MGLMTDAQATLDAFGRLRVSNPFTLYDGKQIHDNLPLLWDEATFGTGDTTHSAEHARTRMTTAASGDAAIRQTFARYNYQPGKSHLIFMTFFVEPARGCRHRIGYFAGSNAADSVPQNGVFLEVNSGTASWNIAKAGSVTETVAQGDWDVDPFNQLSLEGTTHILFIAMEWLGVGTVTTGFVNNGQLFTCHTFDHANLPFDSVYTSTPNLPLNYSTYQYAENTSGTLDAICATVISEGGAEPLGVTRVHDTGVTSITCGATDTVYPLLGIRLKTTYDGASVTPDNVSTIATSQNDNYRIGLAINPTITGTFDYSDLSQSACQAATGDGTATMAGGTLQAAQYVSAASRQITFNPRVLPRIGKAIDGTMDTLVVFAQPISGSTDILAALSWTEQV